MARRAFLAALALLAGVALLLSSPARTKGAAIGFLDQWGCPLTVPQPDSDFHGVHSVAVRQDGATVWVGEDANGTGKDRVFALTPSGKTLTTWTSGAAGRFSYPVLGLSSDGLYVGSASFAPSVQRFAASGTSVSPGPAWGPTADAYFELGVRAVVGSQVGATGFVVVVEEPDLTTSTNVFMFSDDGLFLTRFTGSSLDNPSLSFNTVSGVATAGGYLWLADSGNGPGGAPWRLLKMMIGPGATGGLTFVESKVFTLPGPPGPIWGTNNGVWVAMRDELSTFAKFDFNGAEVMRFDTNDVPGGLRKVTGIAADQFDDVYLADVSRLVKFGPGGEPRGSGASKVLPTEKCIGTAGASPGGTPSTSPGPGATPSPTGEGDLGLRISTASRSILRLGGPVFTVRCDTPCIASASGKASIAEEGRTYRLSRVRGKRYARVTTLHPRLGPRAMRGIRAALARGHRVLLQVRLGALDRDGAGESQVVLKRVR